MTQESTGTAKEESMKLTVYFSRRIEGLDVPIRLGLALLVPAAAFAQQVESAMLFGFLVLIDLLGVAFVIMLFSFGVDKEPPTLLQVNKVTRIKDGEAHSMVRFAG